MVRKRVLQATLGFVLFVGLTILTTPQARADNCGSLSDCFDSTGAAVAALVAAAVLIGIFIGLPALLGVAAAEEAAAAAAAAEEVAAAAAAAEEAAAAEAAATEAVAEEAAAEEAAEAAAEAEAESGPGAWEEVNESMSARAEQYQAQVTGEPPGSAYRVGDVNFDGYKDGTLIEAKGPGYANFVQNNGEFQPWFNGKDALLDQAARQIAAAQGNPIEWHVAEQEAADAIRTLLENNGYGSIKVIFTPPLP